MLASHKSFSDECRNDLSQTTTGIGYKYKEPAPYPPEKFKQRCRDPLPTRLAQPPANPLLIEDVYTTTSQSHYCPQPQKTVLDHPKYKKAPGHWKVHYNQQCTDKMNKHPQRRALTMGNQKTEAKDVYSTKALDGSIFPRERDLRPPTLADHLEEGPTKDLVATTKDTKIKDILHHSSDPTAMFQDDPYLSTSHHHHRAFTEDELKSYPKQDVTSYWQWEGFPPAWGYSTLGSDKPRQVVKREETMRDRTWFKSPTTVERMPTVTTVPPNKGMKTLYGESFQDISPEKRRELFASSVKSPPLETMTMGVTAKEMLDATPNMYKTSYTAQTEQATMLT